MAAWRRARREPLRLLQRAAVAVASGEVLRGGWRSRVSYEVAGGRE